MSYSDYNYQSSSNFNSTGSYETAYNQVGYDTSQYSSSDPYSVDKTQQYSSQYDYTYADSYSQPSDPAGSAPPYFNTSTNDYNPTSNSYTQGSVTQNLSSGYDASQGYQQPSLYQYSKSAEQDTTATSNNQSYSSSNAGFETSGLYDYSAAGSYSTILKDQYNQPQDSYSYNSATTQSFEDQDHVSSADYTAQYSKSNEYSAPSNVNNRVSYQYEDTTSSLRNQNTQPGGYGNSYSTTGGYPSSQTAGSYQSGLSSSSGYPGSLSSGGYSDNNNINTQSGADVFQNTQSSGYYSSRSFDTNRNSLNNNFNSNKKDASTYRGFSYSPKKEYGSFHQTERGGFRPQSQSDNYSRSTGTNFSRGRDNFSQRREERGAAITARNFNSQGRMNNDQVTVSTSDNARSFSSSNSWRGARNGSGQLSQNRGGYNSNRNENLNHSYPRGGKFNNHSSRDNRGFTDTGNQFRSQNQSTGSFVDRLGSRKPLGNKDIGSETNSIKTTSYSEPGHQRSPQKNIVDKSTKDEGKAPFYPNQKLLNEIEEKKSEVLTKEKVNTPVEAKVVHQDALKDLISKKNEENTQKTTTEQDKDKPTDIPLKILAPPSKVPETPEEIAKEEEIQRKIRESIVVVNPDNEKSLLSDDPLKEVEMSDELRDLLKTLTSEHFCKLCTLRMIGPQMATMHYNGKNHLKKVRIFVQTNGRSAGYNMDTLNENDVTDSTKSEEKVVPEEETELDEKKYCKICKVAFSQESQSEMHYKGKNHAKKLRSIANGSEIFECKICCVTVTAQEHLTAHLNGARHKLQIRKMDGDSTHRGGLRGGRGGGYRGRGGRGGGQSGNGDDDNKVQGQTGFRGRGNGRGRGQNWRGGYGRGFKRPTDSFNFGGSYDKRPRYTNFSL